MKKNLTNEAWYSHALFKTFRVMRITLGLLLILVIQGFAVKSYSQKTLLSLDMRNANIVEVLEEIENQTDYYFLFNYEQIKLVEKLNVKLTDSNIEETLNYLLKESNLQYKITDRQIVITQKPGSTSVIAAQKIKISGKVTDKSGAPLPGVTVVVKGTTNGTITNFDGVYTLSDVPSDGAIQFSFVGMKMQEISVAGKTVINTVMEDDAIGIEEVVAVGYGTMKKSDLTGAVSSVSTTTLSGQPSLRVEEAMQGKVAGVLIQKTSGEPGGTLRVRIRGVNSIQGDNSPLYVVDGVLGADINSVNVNDIESVEVLKDASATAVYGSRGSNGVVLVTTKSAKKGQSFVTVNSKVGFDRIINRMESTTPLEFMSIVNTAYENIGINKPFSSNDISAYANDPEKGTNWLDEMLQTGLTQDHQIAVQGATDKLDYYVSGSYTDVNAIVKNQAYARYGVRSNLNVKLSERANFSFNINATRTEKDGNNPNFQGALMYSPLPEVYDENGEYTLPPGIGTDVTNNPMYSTNEVTKYDIIDRVSTRLKFDFEITKDLTYVLTGAAETSSANKNIFQRYIPGESENSSTASVIDSKFLMWQITNQLNYSKKIKDHSLNVSLIQEAQSFHSASNTIEGSIFSTNSLSYHNLSLAEISTVSSSDSKNTLASFLGRVNYNFKDKYLLTLSMRADGSSKFATANKWSYFPSAALAWRLSEEEFFPEVAAIDGLKVRLSYGEVGSQAIASYQTLASLSIPSLTIPVSEGDFKAPIMLGDPANPDLKWETTAQYDAGIDLNMLRGRLNLVADYYYKKTTDLLYAVSLPMFAGTNSGTQVQNIGAMENQGFEFQINGTLIQKRDLSLDLALNFSNNKNKFLGIDGIDEDIFITGEQYNLSHMGGIVPFVLQKGQPLANIVGLIYEGPYKSSEAEEAASYGFEPGAPKYKDVNEDGKINSSDAVPIGNGAPENIWGFSANLTYKNFDFSMFVQAVQGVDMLNLDRFMMSRYYTNPDLLNAWSPDNEDTDQWAYVTNSLILGGSTHTLEDGSFVRLKNVTLGYTLPKNIVSRLGLKDIRLYMNAQNIFTITDFTGFDPEASGSGDRDLSQGVASKSYPNAKSINFGVNLKF